MDFKIIKTVIESVAGHGLKEVIPSTMGEPLLYPKMEHFLRLIDKHNLRLNLTTNGTFPRLGPEKWAEKILPLASDIKISINGATRSIAEDIMVGIEFEKHISAITRFIKIRDELFSNRNGRPSITFQVTYMEKNLEELPKILELATDLGVDRFKGHHLWITWPRLENQSLLRNIDSRRRWNHMVQRLQKIARTKRLPNGKYIMLDNLYQIPLIRKESALAEDWLCPFIGREAWIAWDGTFNVCCAPDNLRRTLGYYGNVNEADFMVLWNSDKYARLVKKWGNYWVCKKCNMRRPKNEREC